MLNLKIKNKIARKLKKVIKNFKSNFWNWDVEIGQYMYYLEHPDREFDRTKPLSFVEFKKKYIEL